MEPSASPARAPVPIPTISTRHRIPVAIELDRVIRSGRREVRESTACALRLWGPPRCPLDLAGRRSYGKRSTPGDPQLTFIPDINAARGAGLFDYDLAQARQARYKTAPDPACEVLAGRVF